MAPSSPASARWRRRQSRLPDRPAARLGHAELFGEDQARMSRPAGPSRSRQSFWPPRRRACRRGWIGRVTGNAVAILGLATVPLTQLRSAHEGGFPPSWQGRFDLNSRSAYGCKPDRGPFSARAFICLDLESREMTLRAAAKYKIDRRMGENIWAAPKPGQQARIRSRSARAAA